jgi:hypothetical protein
MFIRIIEVKTAKEIDSKASLEEFKRVSTTYFDYVIEVDKFIDDPAYIYVVTYDKGIYTVAKDTGGLPDMLHTFAGWPWKEKPGVDNGTTIVVAPESIDSKL